MRDLPAIPSLVLVVLAAACSAPDPEPLGVVHQAETALGDWSDYGDGQCVIGARTFYTQRFGVTLTQTGLQQGDIGDCRYLGACMFWVSPVVQPDPAVWDRFDWGSTMPQLYDLVILPPTPNNGYGHVASIDHLNGNDPSDYTRLWVMDSNWYGNEMVSPEIHDGLYEPYGFYRLKSLSGPYCAPGWGAYLNCGDQPGLSGTDANTLYECANQNGSEAIAVEYCSWGCVHNPAGSDDACAPPPLGGSLDDAGCDTLKGTVHDGKGAAVSATVQIFVDAAAGDPGASAVATTTSDSVTGAWSIAVPAVVTDGVPHAVHAYALPGSGAPVELAGSPASVHCPSPESDAGAGGSGGSGGSETGGTSGSSDAGSAGAGAAAGAGGTESGEGAGGSAFQQQDQSGSCTISSKTSRGQDLLLAMAVVLLAALARRRGSASCRRTVYHEPVDV